jgi:hypothetical protein
VPDTYTCSFWSHPGVELRENLKSISHRSHLFEVAFVWELTEETMHLPLGCLQGGDSGPYDRRHDKTTEAERTTSSQKCDAVLRRVRI